MKRSILCITVLASALVVSCGRAAPIHLPFDGSLDDTGSGHVVATSGGAAPQFDLGAHGKALILKPGSWVDLKCDLNLAKGVTMEAWVKLSQAAPKAQRLHLIGFGPDLELCLEVDGKGETFAAAVVDGQEAIDTHAITLNEWTRLALVYEPGYDKTRLYVDALPAADCPAHALKPHDSVRIGDGPFGLIDDVTILNECLSEEQVGADFK